MKKYLTVMLILFFYNAFSQFQKDEGITVRFNKEIEATYSIYKTPIRINQVKLKSEIDYSTNEGLIQSFFSASNREWAFSDYIDKRQKIVRDEEHFKAVSKRDVFNNYIQIETIYYYNYEGRNMAFVKYSFIIDKIPFPLTGVLSTEKVNNKWYISDLLNQRYITNVFSKLEPSILLELLKGKSDNNKFINELIEETRNEKNILDFKKLNNLLQNWEEKEETEKLHKVKDKRLVLENFKSPKAIINSIPQIYKIKSSQSFILEKCFFLKYSSSENKLIDNEKTKKNYKGKPEFNLVSTDEKTLVHKFVFEDNNSIYSIIKYGVNNVYKAILLKKLNGTTYKEVTNEYLDWVNFFRRIKSELFYDLYTNENLIELKNQIINDERILDIDKFIEVVNKNELLLSDYIDK